MAQLARGLERLVLVVLGLLVALVAAEFGVRLIGLGQPADLGPEFDRQTILFRAQSTRTNPWSQQAEDPLRLAVIGDSFTVGESNLRYDAYPARLRWMLNLNDGVRPAEVMVFARRGLATVEQIPLLRQALTLEPDLVILGITLNDPELPGNPNMRAWREEMMSRPPAGWAAHLTRVSKLATLVYQRLERLRMARVRSRYGASLYDPESEGWKTFERSLATAERVGRRHDVPVVAVVFPTMNGLDDGYDLARGHHQIHATLDKVGLPYFDLMSAFVGKSDERMAAFAEIDAHPSEIAHRLAALKIFVWLLDEGLIDETYRPRETYVERSEEQWLTLTRRMRSIAATP